MRLPTVLRSSALAAALLAGLYAAPARGQIAVPSDPAAAGGGAGGETERGLVRAAPRTGQIRLDGRLDEAAWANALPVTDFTQREPDEGSPVSERTEVRIVFDAEALYVGARLHDRGPVSAPLGRRDMVLLSSDWIGVLLDARHDHRTAVSFWVNPAGVRTDGAVSDEGIAWSWNAVWNARASTDSAGWTAEMRIPFSQLRFTPGDEQTWGVQIQRIIGRRGEFAFSAFTPRSERDGVARYGHLRGLRGLRPGQRLEVAPYTLARSERIDPGANPFRGGAETGGSAGVDLRLRLSSALVLDATVNPDFGTVEADPAEVNLSAFETQLSEQRPFFVEGADLFDFGRGALGGSMNRRLFYSRRIGRRPQLGAPVAAADAPRTATILGAAKVTGRTAGGWSLGVLDAVTQEERLRWVNAAGAEQAGVAEPRTHYLAARATRELNGGRSWVGAMGTLVQRSLADSAAAAVLRGAAYVGGVDFGHEFAARAWRLSGYLAASRVEGTAEAIAATQRSSAHNFQRPDARHLRLDPRATALGGWTGQLQLARQAGEHWLGEAWVTATSPGFQANDLGFHPRADQRGAGGRLVFVQNRPRTPLLRSLRVEGTAAAWFNQAGERVGNNLLLGTQWQHPSFWRLTANVGGSLANPIHDRLTRGGPAAKYPGEWRVFGELASDSRRAVTAGLSVFARGGPNSWERTVAGRVHLQPTPRWSLSLEPALVRTRVDAQYVRQVDDPHATHTFGRRYVFADLGQTTLSMGTRLNVAFTPDLSLQVFAQPFLSAGDFGAYREFTTPRGFDFAEYGREIGTTRPAEGGGTVVDPDGPAGPAREFTVGTSWDQRDFNLRSLRGSAVLRWEWRPGSTLFLAWQQERESRLSDTGDFRPGRDLGGLLGSAPDNVLVLKATYWFAP